jgi:hypothetical protein
MDKRFIFCVLLCCLGFLTGCTTRTFQTEKSENFVGEALLHSRLWAHVRSVSGTSYFMIENEKPDYFEVAVGASLPERYDRWGTVRVLKRDGKVQKLDYDKNGEEIWVDDMLKGSPK